jgi:hypothetical protein
MSFCTKPGVMTDGTIFTFCHFLLSEHNYKANLPGPENDRTMIFYNEARVDGLVKREEMPIAMTEHFIDRADFLYYRHVEFGKRPKKFGPADVITSRPIFVSSC